ncbi:MAG: CBS domain-containing protein, partial [Desulfobacteraceae bacterium]|nr:CBS domain-containing protein [Desulfobacteraceae bacterium]
MKTTAKDVMKTNYKTLSPESSIFEALKIFKSSKQDGNTIFGIMVTEKDGSIAGMMSMYDILLFLLPKHVKIWGNIDDIEIEGIIDRSTDRLKNLLVGDIMTPKVISITPDMHLMMILDIMIKKHVRRLPVVSNGEAIGMVYISDLF